ncbi:ShlB/FhaC/HecB family hemolysin secretion/activation protein [Pseudomonas pudica]|uniref:ShlB/FhaC/HecB family hemolysin secretion/activation protein n=1 Tax=Pseudomonas pudica TaxID=272772 RepID=A0ABS0G4T6_9PSED|nr:ShlB/FhaC/HecB family hemolysin secretion/activation protein [Pseudomonas pudica]MBF8647615.1 ShlB/FhaC/HecB family hemolysin secretion/activation protein [Pseudomonas pudica]MBF8761796.1 ShlB/FhaC/HecB family hemolysin secretion/activation protein [Pseudomonas pudica]
MRPLVVPLLLLPWALAAHAEPLPGFLDSHEYERRLPGANLPIDAYRPVSAHLQLGVADGDSPAWSPANTPLVLHKVRFEGGTVFPLSDLREHYQPLIGRQTTLGELLQYTARLTQRYRQEGYLLSYAYLPPQELADGRVNVVLVEGYIRDYRVDGDIGPAGAYLHQLLGRLATERPLTRETLERYMGLAERLPGVTIEPQLAVAQTTAGAARLTVRARRKPFSAAVTVADGNRDDAQALLTATSHAQTRFAEQIEASLALPPGTDQVHYQRLAYSQYLDAGGSQLLLSASRYRSEPGTRIRLDDGRDITRKIDSDRYAIGLRQPVIVRPDEWMVVQGQVYSVSEHLEDRLDGVPSARNYDTYVRAVSFEGDWRKVEEGRLRIVSAGVYQGLDYLGARSDADYDLDFLRLRLSGLQSDTLLGSWQGVVSGALYWSDDRLPDSERAGFGGQSFGRGYPRDQADGDKGWGVAYELNYSMHANWLALVQPYVVLDTAQAWHNRGPVEDAHLASAALGVRLGDGRLFNVALELAKPLADVALDSLGRGPRLTLTLGVQM